MRTCKHCNCSIDHLAKQAEYCSDNCRKKATRKAKHVLTVCGVCGSEYLPTHAKQTRCPTCQENDKRERDRRAQYETPDFKGVDGEAVKGDYLFRMPSKANPYKLFSEGNNYTFVNDFGKAFIQESHYVMLQIDGEEPLLAPCLLNESLPLKALRTKDILDYLIKQKSKLVGYYLGYDKRNFFADIPLEKYEAAIVNNREIKIGKYLVHVFMGKYMTIRTPNPNPKSYPKGVVKLNEYGHPALSFQSVKIQDYSGYFQTSFENMMKGYDYIIDPKDKEIIKRGKADRNKFKRSNWRAIAEYNQAECRVMSLTSKALFDDMAKGFKDFAQVLKQKGFIEFSKPIIPKSDDAYSPGALSNQAFKVIGWKKAHPTFNTSEFKDKFLNTFPDDYDKDITKKTLEGLCIDLHNDDYSGVVLSNEWRERMGAYPFLAAYFGGRIESTRVGLIKPLKIAFTVTDPEVCRIYGYDIRSGYPMAISMMPQWDEDSAKYTDNVIEIDGVITSRKAGMFLLDWQLENNWVTYPFPYRTDKDSVFFPARGKGWVSCLEYYAYLDTVGNGGDNTVNVQAALYLDNTDNQGYVSHTKEPPTRMGQFFVEMFNERAVMKKAKNPGQVALKLTPNGFYGKLIQQIGVKDWRDSKKIKNFNDFAAMWTSAYCRATVWLAIAEYRKDDKAVISIQTDGVYSLKPLKVDTRIKLGSWEEEHNLGMGEFLNFMPGIYRYYSQDLNTKTGLIEYGVTRKSRGMKKPIKINDDVWNENENTMQWAEIEQGTFSHDKAWESVQKDYIKQGGKPYTLKPESFVCRYIADLQFNRFLLARINGENTLTEMINRASFDKKENKVYFANKLKSGSVFTGGLQWHSMAKEMKISLSSKRKANKSAIIFTPNQTSKYFPPRLNTDIIYKGHFMSKPYIPDFSNPESRDIIDVGLINDILDRAQSGLDSGGDRGRNER